MFHVFDKLTGEHLGWTENQRDDTTEVAPQTPTDTHIGYWNGSAWEMRQRSSLIDQMREQRNSRLDDSDALILRAIEKFTAVLASKLPSESGAQQELEAMVAYRQQLRDLPAATEDPLAVAWPEKPAVGE